MTRAQIAAFSGCALFLWSPLLAVADLADAANLWPITSKPEQAQPQQLSILSEAEAKAPPSLQPAIRFQRAFLQILSNQEPSHQRLSSLSSKEQAPKEPAGIPELRRLITLDRPEDPLAHGVAEVARIWVARANMLRIDRELTLFYRHHVRFPAQFSEIESGLPEDLRRDPWGEPWVYQCLAPQGMAKLSDQRYQVGPTRFPKLEPLQEAIRNRPANAISWKLSLVRIANAPAIEFQQTNGSKAILQPGGKIGSHTLLYIADHWILMAGSDQLFALPLN